MRTLSFLILRYWLTLYISFFIGLNLIALMGDFINNMLRSQSEVTEILYNYFYNISEMLEKIIPISALMASLFCLSRLKQSSELTAMFSLGFSRIRLIGLFTLFGLFVGLIQLYNLGFLSPQLLKAQSKSEDQQSGFNSGKQWLRNKGYFMAYAFYDEVQNKLLKPEIYFYDEKTYQLNQAILAKEGVYDIEEHQWLFSNIEYYKNLDGQLFPVKSNIDSESIVIHEEPVDLKRYQSNILTLSIFELHHFLNNLQETGLNLTDYLTSVFNHYSMVLTCLLFTLLPLALSSSSNRRSGGQGNLFAYSFLFFIGFWTSQGFIINLTLGEVFPYYLGPFVIPLFMLVYLLISFIKQEKSL